MTEFNAIRLQAAIDSLAHWERMIWTEAKGWSEGWGSGDCALCKFTGWKTETQEINCDICPIVLSGQNRCEFLSSSYIKTRETHDTSYIKDCLRKAIQWELDQLPGVVIRREQGEVPKAEPKADPFPPGTVLIRSETGWIGVSVKDNDAWPVLDKNSVFFPGGNWSSLYSAKEIFYLFPKETVIFSPSLHPIANIPNWDAFLKCLDEGGFPVKPILPNDFKQRPKFKVGDVIFYTYQSSLYQNMVGVVIDAIGTSEGNPYVYFNKRVEKWACLVEYCTIYDPIKHSPVNLEDFRADLDQCPVTPKFSPDFKRWEPKVGKWVVWAKKLSIYECHGPSYGPNNCQLTIKIPGWEGHNAAMAGVDDGEENHYFVHVSELSPIPDLAKYIHEHPDCPNIEAVINYLLEGKK